MGMIYIHKAETLILIKGIEAGKKFLRACGVRDAEAK
jgi:hypothetical protein